MGKMAVSSDQAANIVTTLGSCVAVMLYDQKSRIAGLAHIMLPEAPKECQQNADLEAKYADLAIDMLVERIASRGGNNMIAKIVGGSSMFATEEGSSMFRIGEKNIAAARRILAEKEIEIIAEDVGGNAGRRVEFEVGSGAVTVHAGIKSKRRI
jgi:chemotaxis protein CheD